MRNGSILAILLAGLAGFGIWPNLVGAASVEQVMISEVQITGQSAKDEFVEIYNGGEENFDLSDCRLRKFTATGNFSLLHRFVAGATIMAKSFYVVGSSEWLGEADEIYSTVQSLANDNSLQLICGDEIFDLVGWGQVTVFENQALDSVVLFDLWSYQRVFDLDTDDNFKDFIVGTSCARCSWPDEENENSLVIEEVEEVLSEVSDEILEETSNEALNETTNSELPEDLPIPNMEELSSESESVVVPELEVSTEIAPVLESVLAPSLTEETTASVATFGDNVETQNPFQKDSQLILLSELYPAPNSGENEYMEIYNAGDVRIDLGGWFITDLSEKKFVLKNLILEPGEYYVVYYAQSKITLNNDEEQINLYNSLGQWRKGVRYVKAPKGKALFLDDGGQWRWGGLSPGFVNPEFVELVINDSSLETGSVDSVVDNNSVGVVVADPAPVLEVVSGEEVKIVNENTSSEKIDTAISSTKVSTKKSKEYKVSNLSAWPTWKANDLLLLQGKVLVDSKWGVTNRCFVGQGNYALPVLCTTLKDKFVFGENVVIKAKVYFKDGKFEYLKAEEVLPYIDKIDLEFKNDQSDFDEYQLWQGSGIIDDLNSSKRLGKIATLDDVWSFKFPKGNDFVVGDQVFWQAIHWKGENYFLLTVGSGKIKNQVFEESFSQNVLVDNSQITPNIDGTWFSAAFGGLGGSCYAVWRWRATFFKFLPKIFS